MKQSNVIFGTLLLAFVIYITLRGQLPAYLSLFSGEGSSSASPSAPAKEKPQAAPDSWKKEFDDIMSNMGFKF